MFKDDRLTWDEYFMQVAVLTSKRSSCLRKKVGAVLVKDHRIIGIGYNGLAPGEKPHCDVYFYNKYINEKTNIYPTFEEYQKSKEFYDEHGLYSIKKELHAESNLFAFCAKNGIATDCCMLYLTESPCTSCAKLVVQTGINKVYYLNLYDRDQDGIKLLLDNNIICQQYKL